MIDLFKKSIDEIIYSLGYGEIIYDISIPSNLQHGDLTSNVALIISSSLRLNPRDVANKIISKMSSDLVLDVEIAGPGFINIYLKKDYLIDNLREILLKGNDYGNNETGLDKIINIEFVSANPTGVLHLGHARGAVYGSSLANIMKKSGYEVVREFYINDAGNQIDNLILSVYARYRELLGLPFEIPDGGYLGEEIILLASVVHKKFGGELTLPNDDAIFRRESLNVLLKQIESDLKNIKVEFDVWTSEQSLHDKGDVYESLNKLKETRNTYIKDDALYLKTSLYGDEKDRVVVKNDGSYTYVVPDIAYHINKYSRNFDALVCVLGADHHGYVDRIRAAMQILGYDVSKMDVRILQMVKLVKDGEEIKMSKRSGTSVSINELVEEVGVDATRYIFASKSLDTQLTFDIDRAISKTNDNPVFYVQYAYARICSILSKNNEKIDNNLYETLDSEDAKMILSKLYEYLDTIVNSSKYRAPHILANYLYELATLFHGFYAKEKIITENKIYTLDKLGLIRAVSIVLKNGLNLLGVSAPEKM